jgi:two-component system sensor histidine kinase/response regulator
MDPEKQTDKLEEAKTKFLAGMSNEIQRAMKDVLMHSDLIKKTGLSASQIELIDKIDLSAHKLSWIVNDILDFFRLELGKVDLQSIDFNIEYLINDIFRKAIEKKEDNPIDTYVDIDKDVPRNLIGDPTRLRQVLVNLVSNAVKFTKQGEVGIIVHNAGHSNSKVGDEVSLRISIKDSGVGIASEQKESIFEFHSREHVEESWEYGGTGLGLAICKLVVDSMEGEIRVESVEGMGSEFIITLPFKQGQSLHEKGIYSLNKAELVGKKAVIVDDNEIARKILNKCCETIGIDVLLISASPKAVLQMLDDSLIEGGAPDLILCDLMMPEMDGYELARTIRANDGFRNIKLIAVTSAVRVGGARNAQDCGFNGFLPKPVFLDELAKVIATVLGSQQEGGPIVTRHMVEELGIKGAKVLVIENDGSGQDLMTECLEAMDCDAKFVSDGQKAVECLKEEIYSLCLLDFDIFRNEGNDIVKIIKEVSRNMPTVVLLTEDTKEIRSQCLDAGVDDFVAKPVDMVALKRVVTRYTEN